MTALEVYKQNPIKFISYILVLIGALNWLSVGIGHGDLVAKVTKSFAPYVFILVGIAGIYLTVMEIKFIKENS